MPSLSDNQNILQQVRSSYKTEFLIFLSKIDFHEYLPDEHKAINIK